MIGEKGFGITGGGAGGSGGGLTPDELAAIQGANNPSASNVFATIADIDSQTRLILSDIYNFTTNPLNDGDSFTISTTMPAGKRLKDLWAKGTDIIGSGAPILTFSIEDDAPDFQSLEAVSIDYNGSYSQISITPETTIANRNIIITATGGDITGGTFDELVCEYIK